MPETIKNIKSKTHNIGESLHKNKSNKGILNNFTR